MRWIPLLFVSAALVCAAAAAQDDGHASARNHVIRITEYRFAAGADPSMTADQVLAALQRAGDGRAELVQTVRVSALDGHPAIAQFGRRATIASSMTTTRGGARNVAVRHEDVGTIVRLTTRPQGAGSLVQLSYETSRIAEAADDATSPPDIPTTRCETAIALMPGEPQLLAGISSDGATHLVVTLEK